MAGVDLCNLPSIVPTNQASLQESLIAIAYSAQFAGSCQRLGRMSEVAIVHGSCAGKNGTKWPDAPLTIVK